MYVGLDLLGSLGFRMLVVPKRGYEWWVFALQ
jgi:hypothetical protein